MHDVVLPSIFVIWMHRFCTKWASDSALWLWLDAFVVGEFVGQEH